MASTQFCQVILPRVSKGDLKLEAIEDTAALGRSQTSVCAGQQRGEYGPEILIHLNANAHVWSFTDSRSRRNKHLSLIFNADLLPRHVERLVLFLVQLFDRLQDLCFIVLDDPLLLSQVVILIGQRTFRHQQPRNIVFRGFFFFLDANINYT